MTAPRVDFYILEGTAVAGRPGFACRIAEKAYRLGHRVFIRTADPEQARYLDELLWTFKAGSFVPHALADETAADKAPPVIIGTRNIPGGATDLLINLSDTLPDEYTRYHRVAEIIDGEDGTRKSGRDRFRRYKDNGHTPETHTIAS